jgi:hypothetical protein
MGILSAHKCMELGKRALTPHTGVVVVMIARIRTEIS